MSSGLIDILNLRQLPEVPSVNVSDFSDVDKLKDDYESFSSVIENVDKANEYKRDVETEAKSFEELPFSDQQSQNKENSTATPIGEVSQPTHASTSPSASPINAPADRASQTAGAFLPNINTQDLSDIVSGIIVPADVASLQLNTDQNVGVNKAISLLASLTNNEGVPVFSTDDLNAISSKLTELGQQLTSISQSPSGLQNAQTIVGNYLDGVFELKQQILNGDINQAQQLIDSGKLTANIDLSLLPEGFDVDNLNKLLADVANKFIDNAKQVINAQAVNAGIVQGEQAETILASGAITKNTPDVLAKQIQDTTKQAAPIQITNDIKPTESAAIIKSESNQVQSQSTSGQGQSLSDQLLQQQGQGTKDSAPGHLTKVDGDGGNIGFKLDQALGQVGAKTAPLQAGTSLAQANDVMAQIKFGVASASAAKEGRNITIQLFPKELGNVDIRMDMTTDGKAKVIVMAEKPDTLNLMQKEAQTLREILQDALKTSESNINLAFEHKDQQQQEFGEFHASSESEDDMTAHQQVAGALSYQNGMMYQLNQGINITV